MTTSATTIFSVIPTVGLPVSCFLPRVVMHGYFHCIVNFFPLVFGMTLCEQFDPNLSPAPLIVVRCVEEIEARARQSPSLDLYKVYKSPASSEVVAELRKKLNEGDKFFFFLNLCRSLVDGREA